jgi:hypothetical protein
MNTNQTEPRAELVQYILQEVYYSEDTNQKLPLPILVKRSMLLSTPKKGFATATKYELTRALFWLADRNIIAIYGNEVVARPRATVAHSPSWSHRKIQATVNGFAKTLHIQKTA